MKIELQNKLVEKYPHFFEYLKEHKGPIIPIQFGFEHDDGWYDLLDRLMENITEYLKKNDFKYNVEVAQIKEKFGGLRFYYSGGNEEIDNIVSFVEDLSYKTCEFCGSTNNIGRTDGWIITCCSNCYSTLDTLKNRNFKLIE